jgi:hypothetical protein
MTTKTARKHRSLGSLVVTDGNEEADTLTTGALIRALSQYPINTPVLGRVDASNGWADSCIIDGTSDATVGDASCVVLDLVPAGLEIL